MPFPNRFIPGARYRVSTWRGIDVSGEVGHLKQGEEVPAGLISDSDMFTLFIQCRIEAIPVEEPIPHDDEEEEEDDDILTQPRKRGRPRSKAA